MADGLAIGLGVGITIFVLLLVVCVYKLWNKHTQRKKSTQSRIILQDFSPGTS
jgi:hypothetical protein